MQLNLEALTSKRSLLAFSAGIDSTALFFLLCEQDIAFDIAIVDYNLRDQAKEEVEYAQELAKRYNKKIFIKNIHLENSNFEKKARDIRYKFFEELIREYKYNYLITAHQLNDKLEWFLMQLSKGAGLPELIGLNQIQKKKDFTIYRPLLDYSKDQLQKYLDDKKIKYFVDESNYDEKYKRNYFRHNFANKFLHEYENGIKKSFEYLENDLNSMKIEHDNFYQNNQLYIYKKCSDINLDIRIIDARLKKLGILLSKAQRDEIIKQKSIVISDKFAICIEEDYIWICPRSLTTMPKKFKEECRVSKIPTLMRSYIFEEKIDIKELKERIATYF